MVYTHVFQCTHLTLVYGNTLGFFFQEILERMQYAMINEGFKILEEGLCSMPEEIDIIW